MNDTRKITAKTELSDEEQAILESYNRSEWQSVEDLPREKRRHQKYAKATLRKDARINILGE